MIETTTTTAITNKLNTSNKCTHTHTYTHTQAHRVHTLTQRDKTINKSFSSSYAF